MSETKELTAIYLDTETVDGVRRKWFEVGENEFAVTDIEGEEIDLLDEEGFPVAKFGTHGYLDTKGQYSRYLHDVAWAIRTIGAY